MARNYVLGKNACAVKTVSPLIEGWELCPDLKTLQSYLSYDMKAEIVVGVTWKGPKVPADLFKHVLGTQGAFPNEETGYVLYFNRAKSEWLIECPTQSGAGARVLFKGLKDIPGFEEVGTIHTHPNMGAFWSGTDMRDQDGHFGIHLVLGTSKGLVQSHRCTIFTPLGHYNQTLWDVFEQVDLTVEYDPVVEWVENINKNNAPPVTTPYNGWMQNPGNWLENRNRVKYPSYEYDSQRGTWRGWEYPEWPEDPKVKGKKPHTIVQATAPESLSYEKTMIYSIVKGTWPADLLRAFDKADSKESVLPYFQKTELAVELLKVLASKLGVDYVKESIIESHDVLSGTADGDTTAMYAEIALSGLSYMTNAARDLENEEALYSLESLMYEYEGLLPGDLADEAYPYESITCGGAADYEDPYEIGDRHVGSEHTEADDSADDDDDDDAGWPTWGKLFGRSRRKPRQED